MTDTPSALVQGTVLARKFRIVRCLGVGGMGAVYEIEHELTKHRRALKLLHPHMTVNPGIVERFLREASAAGRVGNPHIVETFDAGTLDGGEPYLVMEMLSGEPLSSRIGRGPLAIADVVDIVGQACDGMKAAHAVGIVHRDLKPDNIFLTERDGKVFVKILDFGISKFDPSQTGGMALTQEGAAMGTPYYMPPEQIRGAKDLDARSDVYSLGVILYECVAGIRPFEAEALTQLAVLIHTGQPKPIDQQRAGLPPGFAELVHGALAADRDKRIPTVGALAAGLARFGPLSFQTASKSAVPVAPPSVVAAQTLATSAAGVSMRAPPAPRRSRAGVLTAGAAALVGVGAMVYFGTRSTSLEPGAAESAEPSPAAAPPQPVLVAPEPPPARPTEPAPTPAQPPVPSAGTAPEPRPRAPLVTPVVPQGPAPAAAVSSPPPAPAPAPAPPPPRRADERGLAKDNPFR